MNELISLSRMVTFCNSPSSSLPDKDLKGKEGFFVEKLLHKSYDTDEEAAFELYNSNPNDVRYKMLKHRIKKKFYNNLFLVNYQKLKVKPFIQGEQECYMLLHHANLFLKQADYKLAELNAKKVLNIATEFDFTNFKIAALEILLFCNSELGAYKSFTANKRQLDTLMLKKAYESEAVNLFLLIRIRLNKSVKSRREYLPQLEKDLDKLEMLWKSSRTFDAFSAYYKAHIWYNELIGDFAKIVELTVLSEKLLESGEVCAQRFDASYNKYVLVYAHLKAAKYDKGLVYAEKFLEEFSQNSHNWFAYLENYFLLAIHSKKYELAGTLLHKVFSNTFYAKLSAAAKERWQLYQAYLSIVDDSSKQNHITNPYLLSLPEYSKDKQGFNVAILILQFFYFLKRKDIEALLYRIESLKKYIHTHLKDTFSLRSKLFLKLLILAVTEDFEADSIRKKGRKHMEKLIDSPTPGDAYAEIEIVPYEHLWELILEVLQQRY
ncbi:hypothetical protein [Pontibacter cellulosilyticus]|uniref:Uncharacterized protein n=1 Tax=Pontibacter cellulosilyticus TaxID=1720253 RepID=A0A923SJX7_9BACT|nr:hypothetical protein [Pontibacter cellulosilyticus]MBC5994359.1 hypothetical protein [Pontibacter cellulosilyticus]